MLGEHTCLLCAVRGNSICSTLQPAELGRLRAIAYRAKFERGQTILGDREPPEFLANIVSGVVKLTKLLPDGRQQIVGLQFKGEFLGRPFSARNPFTAEAASDVELCCFPKKAMEEILHEMPDLEHKMFESALDELDAARNWMVLLGKKSAQEKLASLLLMVALRHRDTPQQDGSTSSSERAFSFDLPLLRNELADYLGLSVETVSRQFTKLKDAGLISADQSRTVHVHDLGGLADAAGPDERMALEEDDRSANRA